MNETFKPLPVIPLQTTLGPRKSQASTAITGFESAVLPAMIDFDRTPPQSLPATTPLSEAMQVMNHADSPVLLITDTDGELKGLISCEHWLNPATLKQLAKVGDNLAELQVTAIMHPVENLPALQFVEVVSASVGQVIATLRQQQQNYLFVVENVTHTSQHLRGLFSLASLGHQLGISFPEL